MSTADAVRLSNDNYQVRLVNWAMPKGDERSYQCEAVFCREDEGFSVHCLNLPGVISEGDTEEEATENIKDAFRETLLYYKESGTTIPWVEDTVTERAEYPVDAKTKWLLVSL